MPMHRQQMTLFAFRAWLPPANHFIKFAPEDIPYAKKRAPPSLCSYQRGSALT